MRPEPPASAKMGGCSTGHRLYLTCIVSLWLLYFEENCKLEEGPGPLT